MADSFERGMCSESPVCVQRKVIIEKNSNATESYKTCYAVTQDLNSTQASEDTLGEQMYLITRAEYKEYIKLRKYYTQQKLANENNQNLKNCEETKLLTPKREIINCINLNPEEDTEKLNQERLSLARRHIEDNKTLIKALQNQIPISTSSETIETSHSTRAGTPFPFVFPNFDNIPPGINVTPVNVSVSTLKHSH